MRDIGPGIKEVHPLIHFHKRNQAQCDPLNLRFLPQVFVRWKAVSQRFPTHKVVRETEHFGERYGPGRLGAYVRNVP